MKEEARFQIRGTVTDFRDETYGDSKKGSLALKVQTSQDKHALFNVSVWDDELCRVAAACKGKHALVLGRLTGGKNERGYFNVWLAADAIMVEPGTERAAGASAPAAAPCGGSDVASRQQSTPHRQAKANGYQPALDEPLPWESELEKDDIPF